MNQLDFRKLDEPTRRAFMEQAARAILGVTILPAGAALAQSAGGGSAKHVIYLFMSGAMSHLDTFDPKPGTEEQGTTKAIATSVPGISVSEHLPRLATQMDKLALVRSLNTTTGAHQPGRYLMRTSYREIASITHPALGAWVLKMLGPGHRDLPGNVFIGNSTQHPGAGFLDANFAPVPIGNPDAGLENTQPPKYLKEDQLERRLRLASSFDRPFQNKYNQRPVRNYSQLYRDAISLLESTDLKAFDLDEEPEKIREAYGDNSLGQGCLLARRLIENNVRFVEVEFGNWDDHRDLFESLPERAANLDQALWALLRDLESKGLLNETLVVLATEFGRTPKINQNAGRDHHPGAFTGVFAGAGIRGGQAFGASDATGFSVKSSPVSVQDFNATIATAVGIPLDKQLISPSGRPFTIADDGKPISAVLS